MIRLKSGETIQPEELMESLVGYGFERTDFVYEPGQFALARRYSRYLFFRE